jgi:plasmid maintenance system antidote protein VapI
MGATILYLDRMRERFQCTDYAVAKMLGMTYPAVRNWRTGSTVMSEEAALKVAKLLDLPPQEVVFAVKADAATTPETKAFWTSAKESVAATTLFALAVVLWATFSGDSVASDQLHPILIPAPAQVSETLCIMFIRRCWLKDPSAQGITLSSAPAAGARNRSLHLRHQR